MWPKEALLLNIAEMRNHCEQKCSEWDSLHGHFPPTKMKLQNLPLVDLPYLRDIAFRYTSPNMTSMISKDTRIADDDFDTTFSDSIQGVCTLDPTPSPSFDLTKWTEDMCSDWDLL